ncbi:MAG: hypothetical protein ABL996_21665 [Micropepsaceae bacterium]
MTSTLKGLTLGVVLAVSAAALSGCGLLIHEAAISGVPTYQEVTTKWERLSGDNGRLIVFYPRLAFGGFALVGVGGSADVIVTVDSKWRTNLTDQTFAFIDLPPGQHEASYFRALLQSKPSITFQVSAGHVTYIEVISENVGKNDWKVVDEPRALELLRSTYHNGKVIRTFDKEDRPIPSFRL